ncbi:uncharacterized protein LOC134247410, partial [Saccostrea cucullata]|uniref:uncharacterized protein LOC134247410 n=1 Tax=Saccostrea cuccullata TaxID=36930 RepID=UPI002ED38A02
MHMYVVISFFLFCPFCKGYWDLYTSPSTTIGGNNVTIFCDYDADDDDFIDSYNINPEMIMEIRQNNSKEDWKEVAITNVTGSYILNTDRNLASYSKFSYRCYQRPYLSCTASIVLSLTHNRCLIDPNLYAIFRCRVSSGSKISQSLEKSILSTKGQSPKKIQDLTIVKSSGERPGDVIQLKCILKVESVNGLPSQ